MGTATALASLASRVRHGLEVSYQAGRDTQMCMHVANHCGHRSVDMICRERRPAPKEAREAIEIRRGRGKTIRRHSERPHRLLVIASDGRGVDQRADVRAMREAGGSGACRHVARDPGRYPEGYLHGWTRGDLGARVEGIGHDDARALEHRRDCNPSDRRHRHVAGPRVRPDGWAETTQVEGRPFARTGTHDAVQTMLLDVSAAAVSQRRRAVEPFESDVLGRPLVQRRTSSSRQPTARLASFTGAGKACSAIIL